MKVLELFAGTRSIGKAFEKRGHKVFSIDWDRKFENIDLYADIGTITSDRIFELFGKPDVVWMSPDCTSYSIAGLRAHRKKNADSGELEPISEYAKMCDKVNSHCIDLLNDIKPSLWFIENPRGGMRTMNFMQSLPRYTITYCKYSQNLPIASRAMKPTDIWTNHPAPRFLPPCRNGDGCHIPAPRGAKTSIQGMKNWQERSTIPEQLCEHIVDICEEFFENEDQKQEFREIPKLKQISLFDLIEEV